MPSGGMQAKDTDTVVAVLSMKEVVVTVVYCCREKNSLPLFSARGSRLGSMASTWLLQGERERLDLAKVARET